jgi:hypothetical protein
MVKRSKHIGLSGIAKVTKNIRRELSKIKNYGEAGLIEAAIVIRRDMDITPPVIPVDTGNLRASWFITSSSGVVQAGRGDTGAISSAASRSRSSRKPLVIMGFSASYSVFVHEANYKQGKRPGSGPKFFEASLKRNAPLVVQLIKRSIKGKGL